MRLSFIGLSSSPLILIALNQPSVHAAPINWGHVGDAAIGFLGTLTVISLALKNREKRDLTVGKEAGSRLAQIYSNPAGNSFGPKGEGVDPFESR